MVNTKATEIEVSGTIRLKEVYKNPKDVRYYRILDGLIEDVDYKSTIKQGKTPAPKIQGEIPITEEEYNHLKEELKNSTAESPVLRVKGKLEIILDSESYA